MEEVGVQRVSSGPVESRCSRTRSTVGNSQAVVRSCSQSPAHSSSTPVNDNSLQIPFLDYIFATYVY